MGFSSSSGTACHYHYCGNFSVIIVSLVVVAFAFKMTRSTAASFKMFLKIDLSNYLLCT